MAFPLLAPMLIGALKILLIKVASIVIVYAVYKALMSFGASLIDWGLSFLTSNVNLSDATIQFSGFAAWIAETMKIGQCITLLMSFCVVRFILQMVKR